MSLVIYALGFGASLFVLVKSSGFLVGVLSNLARILKISEFAVGFIFVALATSLPELAVGFTSSFEKIPILTLMTVVGTAPVNLAFILGLAAILAGGIRAQPHVFKKDTFPMLIASLAPIIFLLDGTLSRVEGAALLLFFAAYMAHAYLTAEAYVKTALVETKEKRGLRAELIRFAIGATLLIGSADLLIRSSKGLVEELGFSLALFGLIVVAFGTSLPELAFAVQSAGKKAGGLILGELMGSSAANATLILGTTALIHPIYLDPKNLNIYLLGIFFYFATFFFFTVFLRNGYRISKEEGVMLILLYVVFLLAQFLI